MDNVILGPWDKPGSERSEAYERRMQAANDIRHLLGEPPDAECRDKYLRLSDKDLSSAANYGARLHARGKLGLFGVITAIPAGVGSLLLGFNSAAMAAGAVGAIGGVAFVSSLTGKTRLKNAIDHRLEHP